jgi:hypothetical protein
LPPLQGKRKKLLLILYPFFPVNGPVTVTSYYHFTCNEIVTSKLAYYGAEPLLRYIYRAEALFLYTSIDMEQFLGKSTKLMLKNPYFFCSQEKVTNYYL